MVTLSTPESVLYDGASSAHDSRSDNATPPDRCKKEHLHTTNDEDTVVSLLKSVHNELDHQYQDVDRPSRQEALRLARQLVTKLETPEDIVLRWGFEIGSQQACLRLGIDLKIFRILVQAGVPISSNDLAEKCQAEETLIIRIMRVITSIGFARETSPRHYALNPVTKAIATAELEAVVRSASNDTVQITARLSEYFRVHGYSNPSENTHCPFRWTFDTDQSYFDWTHADTERNADLNTSMKAMRGARGHWTDYYPVDEDILAGNEKLQPDDVLMVDLGGGKGHDLATFAKRFPDAKGRLVLQELSGVVNTFDYPEYVNRIQVTIHDFFAPQPIKGARVYFTHFVFHNWPDAQARAILLRLRAAMTPGYSKILLNESVLPDMDCPAFFAAGDINMMCLSAGIKRSRSHWVSLIESAGFRGARFWAPVQSGEIENVIEIGLSEQEKQEQKEQEEKIVKLV